MPNDLRDVRAPGWFWAHNELIERDGADLGVYGIAVYCVLAKMAGEKHVAMPSVGTIAKKIGCSSNKARDALQQLEEMGWIKIRPRSAVSSDGKTYQLSNEYLLLNNGTPQHAVPTPPDEEGTPQSGEGGTPPDGDEKDNRYIDKEKNGVGVVLDMSTVNTFYQSEFGAVTPLIDKALRELVEEHGAGEVLDAMRIAVEANARKLSYVKGVLKRKKRGSKKHRPGKSGSIYEDGNIPDFVEH